MKDRRAGIKVNAGVKAGGWNVQQNRRPSGVRVRAALKAGGINMQHNRAPRRS
jgi:hypothetical protein